jgi:outer membrane lipoprotein carrier protein
MLESGMSWLRLLAVVGLFSLGFTALGAQQPASPDVLARGLQSRYQTIKDFSAEFTQTYRGGVLKTRSSERGTVIVKKPGMMKWVYTSPERRELVSDGKQIYWYIPADKQVEVFDVPEGNRASTPDLFLSGRGDVIRDFTASAAESAVPGAVGLKLVPRRTEPEYEYLIVSLDPTTFQIRALATRDRQGGQSTLILEKLKENRGISDKEFVFRPPRGVTVIHDAQK